MKPEDLVITSNFLSRCECEGTVLQGLQGRLTTGGEHRVPSHLNSGPRSYTALAAPGGLRSMPSSTSSSTGSPASTNRGSSGTSVLCETSSRSRPMTHPLSTHLYLPFHSVLSVSLDGAEEVVYPLLCGHQEPLQHLPRVHLQRREVRGLDLAVGTLDFPGGDPLEELFRHEIMGLLPGVFQFEPGRDTLLEDDGRGRKGVLGHRDGDGFHLRPVGPGERLGEIRAFRGDRGRHKENKG